MERLLTLQREIATKNYKRFLGRTMRVLVEGDNKRGDGWLFGKSNEAIIVEFMGDRSLIGTFVSVQITESKNWAVSGRLLDDERKEAVQNDSRGSSTDIGKMYSGRPRYQQYQQAKQNNDADTALQEQIGAFNMKRMSYQRKMDEDPKKMQKPCRLWKKNWMPSIRRS